MSNIKKSFLTWAEIDATALKNNIRALKRSVGDDVLLAPCVKANAYGHGIFPISKLLIQNGADWLCVNSIDEAVKLRDSGITSPIYILGYVMEKDLEEVVRQNFRIVVYNKPTLLGLSVATKKLKRPVNVHLKLETGNNRQGILMEDIVTFAKFAKKLPGINIEGISTHFASIEDSLKQNYAKSQLENFKKVIAELNKAGIKIPLRNCANSAATILFPETHFELVRPGIAVYGLWPSNEVKIMAKKKSLNITLKPVLSWKTRIAQIKEIPAGSYVGYGCTYRAKRKTRLAILPVGYYDGYDRGFSNKSHVLIHGKRAKLLGRVCMNIIMVDITDIPNARVEDTATLLGKDGREEISAEYLAELIGTINYEIPTRINEGIPRIMTQ